MELKLLRKREFLIPAIYLIFVTVCIFVAFDFEGRIVPIAWIVLLVITLPWSIISIFFGWAIIHGVALEFFAVMYFGFAIVNAFFIYLIAKPKIKGLQSLNLD